MNQAVPWGGNSRNFFEPVSTSSQTNKPIPLGPDGRPIHPLRMHPVHPEPERGPGRPEGPPNPTIIVTEPSSSTVSQSAVNEDGLEEFYDVWPDRSYQRRKENEAKYPNVWPDRSYQHNKEKEAEYHDVWPDRSYQRSKGKDVEYHNVSPDQSCQHDKGKEVEYHEMCPDRSYKNNNGKEVGYPDALPDRSHQRNKGKEVEHSELIVAEGKDKASKRTRFYAEPPQPEMANRSITVPSEPVRDTINKINPPVTPIAHTNTIASAHSTSSSVFRRYFSKKAQPLSVTPSAPAHFNVNYSFEDSRSMKRRLKKREAAAWRAQGFDNGHRPISMKRIGRAIWPWKRSDED